MTERGRGAVWRDKDALHIGPSRLAWEGDALVIRIDEVTSPWPSRIRGVVRVHPAAHADHTVALDGPGHHRWSPLAPCARVEVELTDPPLRWHGKGYLDSNAGDRPLERDFSRWDWSRANLGGGRSAVLYEVTRLGGDPLSLALEFDAQGGSRRFAPPPLAALPGSAWRVARSTRSDKGSAPRIARSLEDVPFYSRSLLEARWLGEDVTAVHESLSLERFGADWVRMLLPFRMPRRGT